VVEGGYGPTAASSRCNTASEQSVDRLRSTNLVTAVAASFQSRTYAPTSAAVALPPLGVYGTTQVMARRPSMGLPSGFYDILPGVGKQTVVTFARQHDWEAQLVFDSGVAVYQPAGLMVKTTVFGLFAGVPKFLDNIAVRIESGKQVRVGTSLRFGVDLSNSPKKHEYASNGEPIVDMITIRGGARASLAEWRTELSAKLGEGKRFKAVARSALVAGASVSLTRIWRDPTTGVETRVDFIAVAKAEAAGEALGVDTRREALSVKGELELQVRIIRSDLQMVSARDMAGWVKQGAHWVASLVSGKAPALNIGTVNGGDKQRASYLASLKASTGTPIWHLAPSSGGKNHGNLALALALNVNAVLRQGGMLGPTEWVRSMDDAAGRLQQLWARSSTAARARWAAALSNRMGINFALPELDALNRRSLLASPMTFREKSARALFH
jgi:hypothetical protein